MKTIGRPMAAEKHLLNKEMLSHESKGEKSKTVSIVRIYLGREFVINL
jgi:hypothetical protein